MTKEDINQIKSCKDSFRITYRISDAMQGNTESGNRRNILYGLYKYHIGITVKINQIITGKYINKVRPIF